MKRFRPRARGRAGRIEKPFSNITIIVREVAANPPTQRPEELAMGQKINPIGLRLGINRTWDSRWFASKGEYGKLLHEDMKIRECLMKSAQAGGDLEDHHRAAAQEVPRHHLFRASGRGHRQEGRGHRQAAQGGRQADDVGSRDQHRRSAQARDRRDAGRRFDRPAARAPRRLPPRHEARGAVGDAPGRRGHPHQLLGPPRRRGNRPPRVVPRGPRAAAHAARRHRLRRRRPPTPPTAPAASRSGSSRARSSSTIRWRRTRSRPTPIIPATAIVRASRTARSRPWPRRAPEQS